MMLNATCLLLACSLSRHCNRTGRRCRGEVFRCWRDCRRCPFRHKRNSEEGVQTLLVAWHVRRHPSLSRRLGSSPRGRRLFVQNQHSGVYETQPFRTTLLGLSSTAMWPCAERWCGRRLDTTERGDRAIDSQSIQRRLRKDHTVTWRRKKQHWRSTGETEKKRYDLKHRPSTFAVGDRVIRYNRRRDTIGKEASWINASMNRTSFPKLWIKVCIALCHPAGPQSKRSLIQRI